MKTRAFGMGKLNVRAQTFDPTALRCAAWRHWSVCAGPKTGRKPYWTFLLNVGAAGRFDRGRLLSFSDSYLWRPGRLFVFGFCLVVSTDPIYAEERKARP